jgi:hypothetical protein
MIIKRKDLKGKWYGMNYFASKELKLTFPIKKNEIYVDKKLKGRMLKRTIAHEKIEVFHMKRGLKYKKADRIAGKFEKNVR